jgi:hypothetical protein
VLATGPAISVALISKLFKTTELVKLAPPLVLNRTPDNVAMPVGIMDGSEPRQLNAPKVVVTYNQYLVPAVNVRGPVGVKV